VRPRLLAAALLLAASSCRSGPPARAVRHELEPMVGKSTISVRSPQRLRLPGAVEEFYRGRGERPAWDRETAGRLLSYLRGVRDQGLDDRRYHRRAIHALLGPRPRAKDLAAADVLLTDAFLACARDLAKGRLDRRTLEPPREDPGVDRLLAETLERALHRRDPRGALAQLEPPDPGYRRLVAAMARHRAIARAGGWRTLPKGAGEDEIRQRLAAEGEGVKGGLDEALRRFQARTGLPETGVLDEATRAELNVPVEARLAAIAANLERERWLSIERDEPAVIVNLPAFELTLERDGADLLHSRVVVGRADLEKGTDTPELDGAIDTVTVNPAWEVPPKIAAEELVPKIVADPSLLSDLSISIADAHGKTVDPRDVDWSRFGGPDPAFRLVQGTGPANPLGKVKLSFPNGHAVYLHDTLSPDLFDRADRDRSHGCIRVERALDLAAVLLGWDRSRLEDAIAPGKTKSFPVDPPVAIHLVYRTAWVDADGTVELRPDLYRRDRALIAALRR
jgi:murein L,D-transpeptidase YcbB/YkuD